MPVSSRYFSHWKPLGCLYSGEGNKDTVQPHQYGLVGASMVQKQWFLLLMLLFF